MAKWKKVEEKEMRAFIEGRVEKVHTAMICDPAITFYWDNDWLTVKGHADYQKALAKVSHDYDIRTNEQKPEYYINEDKA